MKSIFLIIILNSIIGLAFAQNNGKFDKYKTGKFTYEGQTTEVEIIRTKTRHTESFHNGKSKLILKVEWLNDSTYLLTHVKSINAPGCVTKGDWIKAIITETNGEKYTCTYTSNKCGSGKSVFIKLE